MKKLNDTITDKTQEKELEITERDRQQFIYDQTWKEILSYPQIISWLVHSNIPMFYSVSPEEIAEKYLEKIEGQAVLDWDAMIPIPGVNTEDLQDNVKTQYDLLYRLRLPEPQEDQYYYLLLNLEPQNKHSPGYPLLNRIILYLCRLVSKQAGMDYFKDPKLFKKPVYSRMQPVYSIWVLPNAPKNRENCIGHLYFKYDVTEPDGEIITEESQLVHGIVLYLGDPDQTGNKGLRLLDIIRQSDMSLTEKSRVFEEEFNFSINMTMKGEVTIMSGSMDWLERQTDERAALRHVKALCESLHMTPHRGCEILKLSPELTEYVLEELSKEKQPFSN